MFQGVTTPTAQAGLAQRPSILLVYAKRFDLERRKLCSDTHVSRVTEPQHKGGGGGGSSVSQILGASFTRAHR